MSLCPDNGIKHSHPTCSHQTRKIYGALRNALLMSFARVGYEMLYYTKNLVGESGTYENDEAVLL